MSHFSTTTKRVEFNLLENNFTFLNGCVCESVYTNPITCIVSCQIVLNNK